MIHFCIVTLGSGDLRDMCVASIAKYAGQNVSVNQVPLPSDTCDPRAHGQAIDEWRRTWKGAIKDTDIVCVMDPDCILLSVWWRIELERAFADWSHADSYVGIWGAGSKEDFGPRVHASMMCVQGKLWNQAEWGFAPCTDPRERTWRDTGGLFCLWAVDHGWRVRPVERGPDWQGASAYWPFPYRNRLWDEPFYYYHERAPMWSHLGGGTHSDPQRLTWWQRYKRRKQIKQRHRWAGAVKEHLKWS